MVVATLTGGATGYYAQPANLINFVNDSPSSGAADEQRDRVEAEQAHLRDVARRGDTHEHAAGSALLAAQSGTKGSKKAKAKAWSKAKASPKTAGSKKWSSSGWPSKTRASGGAAGSSDSPSSGSASSASGNLARWARSAGTAGSARSARSAASDSSESSGSVISVPSWQLTSNLTNATNATSWANSTRFSGNVSAVAPPPPPPYVFVASPRPPSPPPGVCGEVGQSACVDFNVTTGETSHTCTSLENSRVGAVPNVNGTYRCELVSDSCGDLGQLACIMTNMTTGVTIHSCTSIAHELSVGAVERIFDGQTMYWCETTGEDCGSVSQPACLEIGDAQGNAIHSCQSDGHPTVGAVPSSAKGDNHTYVCEVCGEPNGPACECTETEERAADNLLDANATMAPCAGVTSHWCRFGPQYIAAQSVDGLYHCVHNDSDTEAEMLCGTLGQQACLDVSTGVYSCRSPSPDGSIVRAMHIIGEPGAPFLCRRCSNDTDADGNSCETGAEYRANTTHPLISNATNATNFNATLNYQTERWLVFDSRVLSPPVPPPVGPAPSPASHWKGGNHSHNRDRHHHLRQRLRGSQLSPTSEPTFGLIIAIVMLSVLLAIVMLVATYYRFDANAKKAALEAEAKAAEAAAPAAEKSVTWGDRLTLSAPRKA